MQPVAHDLDLDPKRYPVRAIAEPGVGLQERARRSRVRGLSGGLADGGKLRRGISGVSAAADRANALDFDDLIMTTVHLLQAFPDLREQYRRRFRHVLVDEYQDTRPCSVRPDPGALRGRSPSRSTAGGHRAAGAHGRGRLGPVDLRLPRCDHPKHQRLRFRLPRCEK